MSDEAVLKAIDDFERELKAFIEEQFGKEVPPQAGIAFGMAADQLRLMVRNIPQMARALKGGSEPDPSLEE